MRFIGQVAPDWQLPLLEEMGLSLYGLALDMNCQEIICYSTVDKKWARFSLPAQHDLMLLPARVKLQSLVTV